MGVLVSELVSVCDPSNYSTAIFNKFQYDLINRHTTDDHNTKDSM